MYKENPWKRLTRDQIMQASDEQLAAWKETAPIIKEENSAIYQGFKAKYLEALALIKSIWGNSSKQAKYLEKQWREFRSPYNAVDRYNEMERLVMEYRKKQVEETKQKERAIEIEKRNQANILKRIEICDKFNLERTEYRTFYNDGLEDDLLTMSKYLKLAYAMMQTRNDWSEGYWRVENALSEFRAETEIDKLIIADIQDCLESSDGFIDGRVFRDTEWSYDRLYQLVDKDLYEAFMELIAL